MATRFDIQSTDTTNLFTKTVLDTAQTTPITLPKEEGTIEKVLEFKRRSDELARQTSESVIGRKLSDEEYIKLQDQMGFALGFTGADLNKVTQLNKVADISLSKLIDTIKSAKPVRKEIEKLASVERAKRAGVATGILEKVEGEKAFIQARGKLKGELVPEKPSFESIRKDIETVDIDNLFIQIQRHPDLTTFEKISTADGLSQILRGTIPQPSKLSLLEDVFGKDLIEVTLKHRSGLEKAKDIFTEVMNVPRALITSFDMSAPLRQGVLFTFTKPLSALKAGKEMFRQVFSEKNYVEWIANIKKDPLYQIMKESNLYIADSTKISTGLAGKEERFMTNFAQKIPILGKLVRASERAYISYLNKLRVDVFAGIANKFRKMGLDFKENKELYESLAGFVNNGTGRGDLGKLNRNAQVLNNIFFSPRLIASRFNLLNPIWYAKQPTPVRKEAIKSFAEFIGVGTTILGIAKLAGADVEYDPRSTDFGKIRIGNTRWDIWGGFQQWARVFSQLASGERKTQRKEIIELSKKKFPFETRLDVAERFLRGKFAPIPSLALELFEGQKLFGEELAFTKEVTENTIPLYLQDIGEAFDQIGPWAMLTVGTPAFFGVGVQTYEEKRKENRFNF